MATDGFTPDQESLLDECANGVLAEIRRAGYSPASKTVKAVVCAVLGTLESEGYSVARLNHAGWQFTSDHRLVELETEDDAQPSQSVPVFTVGKTSFFLPRLGSVEDDPD